ncbi:MAG: exosome complex RNA-binding protein Csl4 [Desulfurococcaceae archaeon TW002]
MRLKNISRLRLVPGDEVCVVEEFLPGRGTYEVEGRVRSAVIGYPVVNLDSRVVEVKCVNNKVRLPAVGVVVYGLVTSMKEDYALIKIFSDSKCVKYSTPFTGILHVSQIHDKYVKSIHDFVKPGDLLKARVVSENPPYHLSIKERQLGVAVAYCSVCGVELIKQGNVLTCPNCKSVESRKISSEYGFLKCV